MHTEDYNENLKDWLIDIDNAAEYLSACFEESEEVFLGGLRKFVECHGDTEKLSKITKQNCQDLYALGAVLDNLGIQIQFVAKLDI